jgi:glycosyltransferase involved in cell wall biosynthesis
MYVDPYFSDRKYQYGLIVSNFDRKIKNVEKSIEFLKGKNNVILIGKGSEKYKSYGFTCVGLVHKDNMVNYYTQIKYIIQDSFFESCSNVKIEGLFNGCRMTPVIVVSSTQYPGYGGAATNAYTIIKSVRKKGYKVVGVFFHNELNVNYDPDNIGGIFLYLTGKYNKRTIMDNCIDYLGGVPTLCLAKNYAAPIMCKEIFNTKTVYLVSGINHQSMFYNKMSFNDLLNLDDVNPIPKELQCLEISDEVIFNSNLTKRFFNKFYRQFSHKFCEKIIDTTGLIVSTKNDTVKKYDIVVCCSHLDRCDKNNLFLIDVLKKPVFDKYTKCFIGIKYKKFQCIKNSIFLGLLEHNETLCNLAKSKILAFPSLLDANPNTVREAYFNKCVPIITNNIGFYELFPERCICSTFNKEEWTTKILYNLNNYESFDFNNDIFKKGYDVCEYLENQVKIKR